MPVWRLNPIQMMRKPATLAGNGTIKTPDGKPGNLYTIDTMVQVARARSGHPVVRECALSVLAAANVPSSFYADEAVAIGRFVQQYVRYVKDPDGIEYLQDPLMLINQMKTFVGAQGDCDDMALLIATLLLAIGHQPYFRAVRYHSSSGGYNHIYVVDYANNRYQPKQRIVLDVIVKDKPIGFEVAQASGDEYPV